MLDVVLDLVLVKNFEDRIGKVEEEWGEAVKERRRMRVELQNLIRSKKLNPGPTAPGLDRQNFGDT